MNNSVYILKDRAILYVNGQDARDFLQNLISNDINKVTDSSSCFASLLTPQGKFLYEFIVVKHKSGFFIDCEKSQSEEILKEEEDNNELGVLTENDKDSLFTECIEIIKKEGKASTSLLQRKLQIGYNRAARIIDQLEEHGYISSANHVGKREINFDKLSG